MWSPLPPQLRVLITLDQGMGDIRAYPPGSHAGIVVLRLPDQSAAAVTQAITDLASFAEPTTLVGAIAVLQRGLLRIAISDGGRLMHRRHPMDRLGSVVRAGPAEPKLVLISAVWGAYWGA